MGMTRETLRALAAACAVLGVAGCSQQGKAGGEAPFEAATGLSVPSPQAAPDAPLTLFVGPASKPALEELVRLYAEKTGQRLEATYMGSGALLTQFTTEKFGDVYVPGSDDYMNKAEERGAIVEASRRELAYLVPMILVRKGNPLGVKGLEDLAREDVRLVLAQPKVVCLGDVSEGILMEAGLWERVRGNVASFAASCEETLNMLLLGEADAIIAWDAYPRQHPDRVEGVPLPDDLVRVRNIPAAVITWSRQPAQAEAFIAFLASEEGKTVFRRHRYTVEWEGEG